MQSDNPEFWDRARQARDQLADQFIDHPDVSLIDIGYAPGREQTEDAIALRIHVRENWVQADPAERVTFPSEIDNIPIIIMSGDYQPE